MSILPNNRCGNVHEKMKQKTNSSLITHKNFWQWCAKMFIRRLLTSSHHHHHDDDSQWHRCCIWPAGCPMEMMMEMMMGNDHQKRKNCLTFALLIYYNKSTEHCCPINAYPPLIWLCCWRETNKIAVGFISNDGPGFSLVHRCTSNRRARATRRQLIVLVRYEWRWRSYYDYSGAELSTKVFVVSIYTIS